MLAAQGCDFGGSVLGVDDEAAVREIVCAGLGDAGFDAVPASTAELALAIFASAPDGFLAVITDVNLASPLTGWDVAVEVRRISPTTPVLFMTGGQDMSQSERAVPRSLMFAKPFDVEHLAAALRAFPIAFPNHLPGVTVISRKRFQR